MPIDLEHTDFGRLSRHLAGCSIGLVGAMVLLFFKICCI